MVQEQRHKIPEPVTYTQYTAGGNITHPPPNCDSLDNNTFDTTLNNDPIKKKISNNTFLNRFTCKRNLRKNSKNVKSVLLRTFSNQSFNNFGSKIPNLQTASMFENRRMSLPSKPFDYALEYFRQQSTRISTDGGGGARRHSFAQFDAVVPTTTRKRVRAESECNPIRKNSLLDTNSDLAKKHKARLDFSERLCVQKHDNGNLSYSVLSASISQVCDQKINFGTQWPFDSKLNSFIKQNEKTPLSSLTLAIINHHNQRAPSAYFSGKDMLKIQSLMLKIERAYQNCEYHNSIHACDVLTATEVLMNQVEVQKNLKFSLEERFSTLLAAACHDVGHPGVTSEHIYKFYKPKRIQRLFYDESVGDERGHAGMLERFHVSLSYAYLEHADLDCLKPDRNSMFEIGDEEFNAPNTDSESKTETENDQQPFFNRDSFIDNFQKCILATDMTKHKNAIDSLKTLNLNKKSPSSSKNNPPSEHSNSELLPIIVHLADLSNPAKEFFDALNWGKRVVSEFFEQGDVEKAFGSEKINKVFDREAGRLEDIQIGFIQHLVVPLFVEWCEFCEDDLLMKLIYANLEVYQSR